jgi:hypothetical protein
MRGQGRSDSSLRSGDAIVEIMLDRGQGVVRFVDDAKSELNKRLQSAYTKRETLTAPMEWKVLGRFQFVADDGTKVSGDLFLPRGMIRVGKQARADLEPVREILKEMNKEVGEALAHK